MIMNSTNPTLAMKSVIRFDNKPVYDYDSDIWDAAWSANHTHYFSLCGNSRVVTWEETASYTDQSKTNGWPENLVYPTKKHFFSDPDARQYLYSIWNSHLLSGKWTAFNTVGSKHELRLTQKVRDGKMRTITPTSTPHVQCVRRLYQDQLLKISANPLKSWTALGFSPFYGGTERLFRYLVEPGFFGGYEFDVSKMDSNLHERVSQMLLHMDYDMLNDEDATIANKTRMLNLRSSIYCAPLVLPDGTVVLKGDEERGGNLSGQFLTTWDNTRFLTFLILYCFAKMFGTENLLANFNDRVRFVGLGDDIIMTVHTSIQHLFTGSYIADTLFFDFNVTLESPDFNWRSIWFLRFLAFGFRYDRENSAVFHVLDPQRVISSIIQGGSDAPDNGRNTPHGQLNRLCGIRIASWGDPDIRKMVRGCIEKHLSTWKDLDSMNSQSPWETAKKAYLSDATLLALYSGRESDSPELSPHLDKIQNIIEEFFPGASPF